MKSLKLQKKKCGVKISYDEYYTNDEFLRRWASQKEDYHVIIFSETIYNIVKDKLPKIRNSKLTNNLKQYNRIIKDHYLKRKYPNNVIYYIHSLTGFLWNPENINISTHDTINSIFKKAKDKTVVIMDDPAEFEKLITASLALDKNKSEQHPTLTINNFKKIINNTKIFITNDYDKIYIQPDFAFSFSWSGEAMLDLISARKNYKFLIHPKLSYIAFDLISQTSSTPGSQCVASFLSSKQAMDVVQDKNYYFSPYTDNSKVTNPAFKKIYREFIYGLYNLSWLEPIDEKEFSKSNTSWQIIKISLNTLSGG